MRSYLDSYSQTMLRTYVARVLESDAVEERGGGPTESRRKEEAGGEGGGNGDADEQAVEEEGGMSPTDSTEEVPKGSPEGRETVAEIQHEWTTWLKAMPEWEKAVTFMLSVRGTPAESDMDEEYFKMVGRLGGPGGGKKMCAKEVSQFKDEYFLMTRGRRVEARLGKISLAINGEQDSRVKAAKAKLDFEEEQNVRTVRQYVEETRQRKAWKQLLVESLEAGIADMQQYIKVLKESEN